MALPGCAGEDGGAAHGGTAVSQQRPQPLEHDLAEQVLLGDAFGSGLPAVADEPQSRRHDLLDRGLDVVERERLLDQRGQPPRVRVGDRGDDRIAQAGRRGFRARIVRLEQRRRLADPEAVREPIAKPFDPSDVALVVAALPTGGAAGAEDAVASLPLAERVGSDPGALCHGRDVESRSELLRCGTCLQVGGHRRREILEDARVLVGPRPRRRVDSAERADRVAAGSDERHADVGDDPEHAGRRAVLDERVGAGVLDQQRPPRPDRVLAGGVRERDAGCRAPGMRRARRSSRSAAARRRRS